MGLIGGAKFDSICGAHIPFETVVGLFLAELSERAARIVAHAAHLGSIEQWLRFGTSTTVVANRGGRATTWCADFAPNAALSLSTLKYRFRGRSSALRIAEFKNTRMRARPSKRKVRAYMKVHAGQCTGES